MQENEEGGILMAGRKPKPTAIKKLEGNPGKKKTVLVKHFCNTFFDKFWFSRLSNILCFYIRYLKPERLRHKPNFMYLIR